MAMISPVSKSQSRRGFRGLAGGDQNRIGVEAQPKGKPLGSTQPAAVMARSEDTLAGRSNIYSDIACSHGEVYLPYRE